MPNMEELKCYAVVPPDGDVKTLEVCMKAAELWLKNAGITGARANGELYDLAVYMLSVYYFDNRGAASDKQQSDIPFGVMSIMHQLRLGAGS